MAVDRGRCQGAARGPGDDQLAAGTPAGNGPPFPALATKPADLWQRDSDDTRRLIVAYAAAGSTSCRGRTVAVAVLDRFTEVGPGLRADDRCGVRLRRAGVARAAGDPARRAAGSRRRGSTGPRSWSRSSPRPGSWPTPGWRDPPTSPAEFGAWLPTGLLPATGATATSRSERSASEEARMIVDIVDRLEADPRLDRPGPRVPRRGRRPVWLLGRQWQLGEHQGEDASSPVRRRGTARRLTPIDPLDGQPRPRPAAGARRGDRRVRAGRLLDRGPPGPDRPAGRGRGGRGRRAAARRARAATRRTPGAVRRARRHRLRRPRAAGCAAPARAATTAWFGADAPAATEPVDLWDPAELGYAADFTAGERRR